MKKKLYAIIDVETTGGVAHRDRVTEVGILLYDGQEVVQTFQTLINPERQIPANITKITGITQDMVADAPKFYEVAKQIVEITEGAVFVAHNVRFDYCFIKEEFKRLGYTYTRRLLCTVRLSRMAFPGLRSYSLGNLIKHFKIKVKHRHRAFEDAEATTVILGKILKQEAGEENIAQLVDLGIKESQLPANINLDQLHALPEECGVYYFLNEAGDMVYVGKSLNIKKRVMEHFAKKTEKARKLQQMVHTISFEITGSELVALLLESHEIKYHMPIVNRAQRRRSLDYAVFMYYNEDGYMCYDVVKATAKAIKNREVVSLFPNLSSAKSALRRLQERFELCLYLCNIETVSKPCFNFHLKQCTGACIGKEHVEDYNERSAAALDTINMVFEESFFIIGDGRSESEKSVVYIEHGVYKGFGYFDKEDGFSGQQELADSISFYESNPDTTRIIRSALNKKSKYKVKVTKLGNKTLIG